MSNITGWVGVKAERTVSGWVADEQRLDDTLSVVVSVGTWTSAPIIAQEYRHHLRQRNFGTAKYGFSIEIPAQIEFPTGGTVEVNVLGQSESKFTTRIPANRRVPPESIGARQSLQIIADAGLPARKDLTSLDDLAPFAKKILESPHLAHLLRDAGRSRSKVGDNSGALRLLGSALQLLPDDKESVFQYAIAASRANLDEEAFTHFERLYPGDWRPARVLSEYIQAVRRKIEKIGHNPDPSIEAKLVELVEARLSLLGNKEGVLPSSVAITLKRLGHNNIALRSIDHTLSLRGDQSNPHIAKARIMIESKRVDEGLNIARSVLERWPENEAAEYMIRAFRHMAGLQANEEVIATLQILKDGRFQFFKNLDDLMGVIISPEDVIPRLRNSAFNWLAICEQRVDGDSVVLKTNIETANQAGFVQVSDSLRLWKATAILDLLDADLVQSRTILDDLERVERFYVRPRPSITPGRAVLISRFGAIRFGGAEHFLHSAALHYAKLGYSPLLLGDIEKISHSNVPDLDSVLDYQFCNMTPAVLRRLIIENDVTLIHAISGMGGLVAAAIGEINIPFVYGVHYFREVLGGDGGEVYFDSEGVPIPRPDFGYILSRASSVYANSTYTRDLIEKAHGVRCPVIFSVPEER